MSQRLGLFEVAKHGVSFALALWHKGGLDHSAKWAMFKGAAKYLTAISTGDIACEREQLNRARICSRCHYRKMKGKDTGDMAIHCGLCLCLVAWIPARSEEVLPAGKTVVATERCPAKERYWPSVERKPMRMA